MNDMQENHRKPGLLGLLTCASGTAADRRNELIFVAWLLAWSLSFVAAKWLLKSGLIESVAMQWVLVVVPNLMAVVAVLTYLRFLRMADEMIRKIQLEGLAIGFGAGAVAAVGYQLFELVGAPALASNHVVVVMMVGWAAGQYLGWRRFR